MNIYISLITQNVNPTSSARGEMGITTETRGREGKLASLPEGSRYQTESVLLESSLFKELPQKILEVFLTSHSKE